ncbi:hypothetical protein ABE236_18170 [Priestia endophytica]|uniref:hypothetical protein n=1 Tax=Priestia endophytica TaxID=135735 RepID=UPI003D2852E9
MNKTKTYIVADLQDLRGTIEEMSSLEEIKSFISGWWEMMESDGDFEGDWEGLEDANKEQLDEYLQGFDHSLFEDMEDLEYLEKQLEQ